MGKALRTKLSQVAVAVLLLFTLAVPTLADAGSYVDEAHGFQLTQTQGWEISSEGKLTLTSPASTERQTINFTVQVIPARDYTAEQFAEVLKAQAGQSFRGKVVSESETVLDGNSAYELVWEAQKNAQNSRYITLLAVKDGKLFMLNGRLPKARYDELAPSISGLVDGFSFLSGN